MLRIKRLHTFMLGRFLPQWCMTFFICLFIFMMQFLFRYISDLVGKGLGLDVLAQLFFYAALSMVPMALPLSILLASLMTFGNLGEHFELTALKSSGISLLTVMKPLIVFICFVSVGAFFFQNNVLPRSQVQMWTLLFSARQKSLTLDITPGTINSQLPGYNLFVKQKNAQTDMLYGIYIYDVGHSTQYPRVIAADSGRLAMAQDQKHLVLNLYHGQWYENMGSGSGGNGSYGSADMFRRESFHDKQLLISYDATFSKIDDNTMRTQYIGKNLDQLRHSIDSMKVGLDSAGRQLGSEILATPLCGVTSQGQATQGVMPVGAPTSADVPATAATDGRSRHFNFDSLYDATTPVERSMILTQAVGTATSLYQDAQFKTYSMMEQAETMRRHQIEMQRKFTLSLACLVFFFIGAPLGAIIRKGGFGTPVVISVLLFVVYYIIDNFGYKMARDAHIPVWQGMWLSSAVLLPLGVFLTYQAVNESTIFSPDAVQGFLRRITGKRFKRNLEIKEVSMRAVRPAEAQHRIQAVQVRISQYLSAHSRQQGYLHFWLQGRDHEAAALSTKINQLVDYLANSRQPQVIEQLNQVPIMHATMRAHLPIVSPVGWTMIIIFPLGLVLYGLGLLHDRRFMRRLQSTTQSLTTVTTLLSESTNQ